MQKESKDLLMRKAQRLYMDENASDETCLLAAILMLLLDD